MRRRWAALAPVVLLVAGCGGSGGLSSADPGDPGRGHELFQSSCAVCHGSDATGTATGPSLVNQIYVPSQHDDQAFYDAVRSGVEQHHWDFGPMPRFNGLSAQQVADIIAYVRGLQREAGLLD